MAGDDPQAQDSPHPPLPAAATPASDEAAIAREVEAEVAGEFVAEGRSPHSPEARRERATRTARANARHGIGHRTYAAIAPGTRPFYVARRVLIGTYFDGFIHAGNLAYLALIALFPFFITARMTLSACSPSSVRPKALITAVAVMKKGKSAINAR